MVCNHILVGYYSYLATGRAQIELVLVGQRESVNMCSGSGNWAWSLSVLITTSLVRYPIHEVLSWSLGCKSVGAQRAS